MVRLNKWTKWLSNIYSIILIINKTIGLITYLQHSLHLTTQSTQLYKRHHSLQITDTTHSFVVNCSIKTDLFQKTQKTKLTKWENYTCNSCKILILWIYKAQFITTNTKKRDQLLKGGRKHFYSAEISKQSNQVKNLIIRKLDHSQLKKKSDKWIIISSYWSLWSEFIQYSIYCYSNLHQRMPKCRRTSKSKVKMNMKLKRFSTTSKLADDHIISWNGKVMIPQKTLGNLLHIWMNVTRRWTNITNSRKIKVLPEGRRSHHLGQARILSCGKSMHLSRLGYLSWSRSIWSSTRWMTKQNQLSAEPTEIGLGVIYVNSST